ncbi:MAG: OmpA family protein [Muribaculaceae bacterium]|nr:OmpA family protein [Muribaculaceae bacterium]
MKLIKASVVLTVCASLFLASCNMSNTGKGALIGGGGGGALGAGIGALIGGGKGAAIGSGIGAAVGAGAGALIGNKMDKQQKALQEELANAKVEQTTDANGLQAIRVTFDGGILFPTGKWTINQSAQNELKQFAQSLQQNPLTDVYIAGFTDNTGSMAANEKVSTNRADAVKNFLASQGVNANRLTAKGYPMTNYLNNNKTAAEQAANRRVEVYIYASKAMIQQAEDGTLK